MGPVRWLPILAVGGAAIAWTSCTDPPVRAAPLHDDATGLVRTCARTGLSDVADLAVRSVVNVAVERPMRWGHGAHRRFGEDPETHDWFGTPPDALQEGLGSGVVLRADGLVVTSAHVVEGATRVTVALPDGRVFEATRLGTDPKSDLAVLQVTDPPEDLTPLTFGDSASLRLGELVLAVGNPFGVGETVTLGIVSAIGRGSVGILDHEDFIQTDAAINPGNSGGALVDGCGRLIGINTAIVTRTGGYQGVGFAVPAHIADRIVRQILDLGHVERGWLGVRIQDVTPEMVPLLGMDTPGGALIVDVEPDSPAERAGLRRGDAVVAIDGAPVRHGADLRNAVAARFSGEEVTLRLIRDGEPMEVVEVALGVHAEEPMAEPRAPVTRVEAADAPEPGGAELHALTAIDRANLQLPDDVSGVLAVRVDPRGPLGRANVVAGDVIVEVNRATVRTPAAFVRAWRATGTDVLILVWHDGDLTYRVASKRLSG